MADDHCGFRSDPGTPLSFSHRVLTNYPLPIPGIRFLCDRLDRACSVVMTNGGEQRPCCGKKPSRGQWGGRLCINVRLGELG